MHDGPTRHVTGESCRAIVSHQARRAGRWQKLDRSFTLMTPCSKLSRRCHNRLPQYGKSSNPVGVVYDERFGHEEENCW